MDPLAKTFAKAVGGYGLVWNALSEEEKDTFIDGYLDAMKHAAFTLQWFCDDARKNLQPGPGFNEQMKAIMTMSVLAQEFDFKTTSPLKPHLDAFYKDPLNKRIPISNAMQYVRDEITGRKTAGQLLDELNDWRKPVNSDSDKVPSR